MNEVSIYKNAKDFVFITPGYNEEYNQKVINEIVNAWKNGGNLDNYGRVWIDVCYLPQILRTNNANARYLLGKIPNKYKMTNETVFVRGTEIGKLIDMGIQSADTISKERNLRYSRNVYHSIVDSETAQLLRAKHMEQIRVEKRKLKDKRMKKYNITRDELTGETLDRTNCQFSHIRSWSVYPELATNIDNGHIVNKGTHDIITSHEINDENELLSLCVERKWDTEWYNSYINIFGSIS